MATFTDGEGQEWTVQVTVQGLKRIYEYTQNNCDYPLDLGRPMTSPVKKENGEPDPAYMPLQRLATDVMLRIGVVYALCEPQAEEQGLTEEEWGERLHSQTIRDAQEALYEELENFFQKMDRTDAAEMVGKQDEVVKECVRQNMEAIEGLDVSEVVNEARGTSGKSSTDSQESSE